MQSLRALIEALRTGVDTDSHDVDVQQRYERWLKCDAWLARDEALPLVVGVEPAEWRTYLDSHGLVETEQALWGAYKAAAAITHDDSAVDIESVVTLFRTNEVGLPASFSRLYDFIRQTTLVAGLPASDTDDLSARDRAGEVETVLGAALSIVAGMPDRCRDEHGFIDGTIVAKLIMQGGVRWFPLTPPTLSEADMAALIDKWLAGPTP